MRASQLTMTSGRARFTIACGTPDPPFICPLFISWPDDDDDDDGDCDEKEATLSLSGDGAKQRTSPGGTPGHDIA